MSWRSCVALFGFVQRGFVQRGLGRCGLGRYGWQFGVGWLLPMHLQSSPGVSGRRTADALLAYLPRLISAMLLLAIAWLLATVLRAAIRKAAALFGSNAAGFWQGESVEGDLVKGDITGESTSADTIGESTKPISERLTDFSVDLEPHTAPKATSIPVSEIVANGVYGLVFLLMLPAIFAALGIF